MLNQDFKRTLGRQSIQSSMTSMFMLHNWVHSAHKKNHF